MKCKECQKQGLKSTVHPGGCITTSMAHEPYYYDEDGKMIKNKDLNTRSQEYACSNGHIWWEDF